MIYLTNQFTFHYYFIITSIIFSKILAEQSYSVNSSENKVYVCMYVCMYVVLINLNKLNSLALLHFSYQISRALVLINLKTPYGLALFDSCTLVRINQKIPNTFPIRLARTCTY